MHIRKFTPRLAAADVDKALATFPVVVIRGPRQSGKSTLAKQLAAAEERSLFTFDDFRTRQAFRADEDAFLQSAKRMVLDEVQREPGVMLALKRAVDAMETAREPGRYLVTGSANLATMHQVADALTGRAAFVTLWPLTRRERLGLTLAGRWSAFLDAPSSEWPEIAKADTAPAADWRTECAVGGFPVPALHLRDTEERDHWHRQYFESFLERDLRDLSKIDEVVDFRRLMQAAALRVGGLLNHTEIGRDVGLKQQRARSYLNLLETAYQAIRVPAYAVNRGKRLIKSAKLYWIDPALALRVAQETEPRGAHFENLVLLDLLAWAESRGDRPQICHWHTSDQYEVDFVVETAQRLLPVEVKTSRSLSTKDLKGLRIFLDEHPHKAAGGLVLYDGDDVFWMGANILAVPWWKVI